MASGPVVSGLVVSGLVVSGLAVSGLAVSGLAVSGPVCHWRCLDRWCLDRRGRRQQGNLAETGNRRCRCRHGHRAVAHERNRLDRAGCPRDGQSLGAGRDSGPGGRLSAQEQIQVGPCTKGNPTLEAGGAIQFDGRGRTGVHHDVLSRRRVEFQGRGAGDLEASRSADGGALQDHRTQSQVGAATIGQY